MVKEPRTLQEAVVFFSNPQNCLDYIASRRWPEGVACPVCGSKSVAFLQTQRRWQCSKRHPKRQFTAKTGTVFEDSPLGLDKWLIAMWLILNCKNGISSYELSRGIGVTQKTAWFMNHRIRLAMQNGSLDKLSGDVEADESYIGGKARNMHHGPRRKLHALGGGMGKEMVLGFVERGGKVRTMHVQTNTRQFIEDTTRATVSHGANLFTDAAGSYRFMSQWFQHRFVDHAVRYAEGHVHTNTLENYWSLLKRAIKGTYVSVEPFHLFRYLDEQAFRYNERTGTDADRFRLGVSQVSGKRLTYAKLTGKEFVQA